MDVLTLVVFLLIEIVFASFIFLISRSGLRDVTNRSFLYFLIAFSLWGAANYASNLTSLPHDTLLTLNRVLFAVSAIGLFALLNFITTATNQRPRKRHIGIIVSATLAATIIALTPLVVADIFIERNGVVGVEFGILAMVYFAIVLFLVGVTFYRLVRGMNQKLSRDRSRAKVLFVSIGTAVVTILVSNVILPVVWGIFSFTMIGLFAGMFIIAGVSYAIVRHGMFDVRYAAVRSVTYSLVLLTLALLYFIFAFIVSGVFGDAFVDSQQAISGVIISLVLALIFQPVKRFFDRVTNKIFYKDDYNSDDFYAALNRIVVSTTDLRSLLKRTAHYIAHTIKGEQAFFLITGLEHSHLSTGTEAYKKLPAGDVRQLEAHFSSHEDVVQTSMIKTDTALRRLLISHKIELVVPLFQAKDLIGMLCLGDHLTAAYTSRDLKVLHTASDEIAIAIQNALSVEEVKELNAHLEQRVNTATKELRASNAQLQRLDESKDEFISMASHQLRTPLTSIKGYISMLMEGDVGEVSKEQRHLLQEAYISSERMVRLIGDFLNVSRLQTGKFVIDKHPVALAQLVQDELDALQPSVIARGLKFIYKAPKNIPMLDLDENKIQQVVMNFSDNAIYYSKEGTVITVTLKKTGDMIEFKVKDNGIGVPADQQDQLFGKFFRATNARKQRPDGTGVGLFLAKKVIDAHGGEIIFSSKENKGSTFGFRLPIERLRARDADKLDD